MMLASKEGGRKEEKVGTSHVYSFFIRKSIFHKNFSIKDFSCFMGQHWVTYKSTAASKSEK